MQPLAIVTLVIIVLNVLVSSAGFNSETLRERFMFSVDDVLIRKQYYRLVTSGFLHLNWLHLIFNMMSLYLFSQMLEPFLGSGPYLVVFVAGLVGGDLLALFIHRHHGDYTSIGASGAVSGIVFASIALFPGMTIFPFSIPGWLFGLAYVLYTIYGVRSKRDNIGHEAHLGGALAGMFTAILFHLEAVENNFVAIAVISLPSIVFIYIIITRPYVLFIDNFYLKQHPNATIDDRYNMTKAEQQREIDAILEKIHRRGMDSLTKTEREKLDEYSRSR